MMHQATTENQFLRIMYTGEVLRSMRLTIKVTILACGWSILCTILASDWSRLCTILASDWCSPSRPPAP